jgi:hypothetical protein
MKECLASSLYNDLSALMILIRNLNDEDKRNLAMLFFSEAVRNIATIFSLLDLQDEKIDGIVFNIKKLVDDE